MSVARQVLLIRADGIIEIGEGYTPTEAGEAFIEALTKMGVTIHRKESTSDQPG